MIRARSTLLFLALMAGLAAPAHAQLAPGRSGSSTVMEVTNIDVLEELAMFGRCFARQQHQGALTLVSTRPGSREEAETYRGLFRREQGCLNGLSLRVPVPYVRGAIAEGLFSAGRPIPNSHVLPAPSSAQVRNLSDAARCYAGSHRIEVRALLETRPGSQEENDAVSALWDDFSACMPAGARNRFTTTLVRYRLTEALLLLAPPAPVTTGN